MHVLCCWHKPTLPLVSTSTQLINVEPQSVRSICYFFTFLVSYFIVSHYVVLWIRRIRHRGQLKSETLDCISDFQMGWHTFFSRSQWLGKKCASLFRLFIVLLDSACPKCPFHRAYPSRAYFAFTGNLRTHHWLFECGKSLLVERYWSNSQGVNRNTEHLPNGHRCRRWNRFRKVWRSTRRPRRRIHTRDSGFNGSWPQPRCV